MKHYNKTNWMNYIYGNICGYERNLMENHMAVCKKCMDEYIRILEDSSFIKLAHHDLVDKIMDSIKAESIEFTTDNNESINKYIESTYIVSVNTEFKKSSSHKRRKIHNRKMQSRLLLRYAVAASISMLLWHFGVFGILSREMSLLKQLPSAHISEKIIEGTQAGSFGDKIVDRITVFFDYIEGPNMDNYRR